MTLPLFSVFESVHFSQGSFLLESIYLLMYVYSDRIHPKCWDGQV